LGIELAADDITITDVAPGAATKDALSGSGTSWTLGISAVTQGSVKVKITTAGIEAAETTVAGY
jgi:hypothetical protein